MKAYRGFESHLLRQFPLILFDKSDFYEFIPHKVHIKNTLGPWPFGPNAGLCRLGGVRALRLPEAGARAFVDVRPAFDTLPGHKRIRPQVVGQLVAGAVATLCASAQAAQAAQAAQDGFGACPPVTGIPGPDMGLAADAEGALGLAG